MNAEALGEINTKPPEQCFDRLISGQNREIRVQDSVECWGVSVNWIKIL